ncbi:MAG: HAMP domain-containing histidine kinase [Bacteroidales bacterium]|nr:HAMP domain-containing histidine kinase [Bacteroidales bacterium]
MSRKLIWIASIIMGLAMIALIMFQFFWIRDAIRINQRQFDHLVSRSMIDIANEIEWQEGEKLVNRQLDPLLADSVLSPQEHSPGSSQSSNNIKNVPAEQGQSGSELNKLLANRRNFVDRVIASMFLTPPDIEERISQAELAEIISEVFNENGIEDRTYEYAVLRRNNEIALASQSFSIAEEAEYYRVKLFPNDIEPGSNYLSIYFPHRKDSSFQSLGYMALTSLALSLIIVVSFTLTVYVMFKQKRLSEIRSDFVSNMTHELKTPISTISLASQMLGDKSIPPEMKKPDQISKIIIDECRRLGTQVEKVLQTAIFDRGKLKLRLQEVNMHEIIENAVENFAFQMKSRNGKIDTSLKAEYPLIFADQLHITNVLSNLIDNAIKYCSRDPGVVISTFNKGSSLCISIRDNGIGIGKNDQRRIFEKFYRVPTGNIHTIKGFGLGLSYVKMIVEEHQGRIELESELYEGSNFRLTLPNIINE